MSALGLALLMLVPGWGLAHLAPQLQAPALAAPLPADALGLADRAFVGSFRQLDHAPGAADVAALQPTLESLLRLYARDRGWTLSPPHPPAPAAEAPLAAALDALALAAGKPLPAEQRAAAAALPAELQGALARIVLAYLEAARAYAGATSGLTRADLAALARGEAPALAPDGGKLASAALLLDRAVRESTPALRKWALLLAIEERTRHPQLADVVPAGLLQAGAAAASPRDAADLAMGLQGWEPVQARFEPVSSRPSEALGRLYAGLGVPVFADDAVAFQVLDHEAEPVQRMLVVAADGLSEAAVRLARAEAMSQAGAEDAAWQALAALDLPGIAAAPPEQVPLAELEAAVQALQRADEALQLRLEAAALLADALAMAKELAPQVASLPGLGGPQTHTTVGSPTLGALDVPPSFGGIAVPIPSVGTCRIDLDRVQFRLSVDEGNPSASAPSFVGVGDTVVACSAAPLPIDTVRAEFEPGTRQLTLYLDYDDDGVAEPEEFLLRSTPTASPANDLVLMDPYGFLLVGGEGSTHYGSQFGAVNVSLRVENGTVTEERKLLYGGSSGALFRGFVQQASRILRTDVNNTVFDPQDNGLVNLTMNPRNHTLLAIDLGGDDAYTNRVAGAEEHLMVWESNFGRVTRRLGVPCTFLPPFSSSNTIFGVTVGTPQAIVGECGDFAGNQVILGLDTSDPGFSQGPSRTYLNTTNLTLPVRLGAVLDTSGSDRYGSPHNFSLGASRAGLGLLWDAERCHPEAARPLPCAATNPGHDVYAGGGNNTTAAASQRGVGILVDERGDDQRSALGNYSLGAGSDRGVAVLLDLHGRDAYLGGNYSLGFGGREVFEDCARVPGASQWRPCFRFSNALFSAAMTHANVTSRPGLGVLLDRLGDDRYAQTNASSAQGKGWPALGLLLDLGGRDEGLQTTLEARTEGAVVALGLQENSLLAVRENTNTLPTITSSGTDLTRPLESGRGGGLIVDAEVEAGSFLPGSPEQATQEGFGMQATEVEGSTPLVMCPSQLATGFNRCEQMPDMDHTFHLVSRQSFLLRVPGLFGLGGTRSHNGIEAPVAREEHLLHVDLGGHDLYQGPFSGATLPDLGALDADGDAQGGQFPVAQAPRYDPLHRGGLVAPVMLTLDLQGSDTYDARTGLLGKDNTTGQPRARNLTTPSLGGARMGMGLLYDLGAAPTEPRPARAGVPAACAGAGRDDVYVAFNRTMGYGSLYGIGALVDREGDDCYLALGGDHGLPKGVPAPAWALGAGRLGGIGALVDAQGNDTYEGDAYAMGAGRLEPTNDHLPARVQGTRFHDGPDAGTEPEDLAALPPSAFGAFLDGRGRDRYLAGAELSQGWGEAQGTSRIAVHTPAQVRTPGPVKALAGLFVDDGFDGDHYASLRPLAAGASPRGDNLLWCTPFQGIPALRPHVQASLQAARGALAMAVLPAYPDFPGGQRPAPQVPPLGAPPGAGPLPPDVEALVADANRQVDAVNTLLRDAHRTLAALALAQAPSAYAQQRALLQAQLDVARAAAGARLDAVEAMKPQDGPHPRATCLDLDAEPGGATGSQGAAVRLTSLGRGFDNLDFFANFLLAAGTFGGEFAKARSVLTAPAVVDLACGNATGALPPQAQWGRSCLGLQGLVQARAQVLWGPASVAYQSVELLRHVCATQTGDAASCEALVSGATVEATCGVKPVGSAAGGPCAGVLGGATLRGACATASGAAPAGPARDLAAGCRAHAGPVGLRLPGDLLRGLPGQDATDLAVFGDALRNLTFALRPAGAPADGSGDLPLGGFDRRHGTQGCARNATTGLFAAPCASNVSAPDAAGVVWLLWNTTVVVPNGTLPPGTACGEQAPARSRGCGLALRTPDGAYDLVARAHQQYDTASCPPEASAAPCPLGALGPDEQRHVLNRLGDEYGFYPGSALRRAVLDNAPVVYELDVRDLSFARRCQDAQDSGCAERPPELALNLTVSPPLGPGARAEGLAEDPAYQLVAEVRRGGPEGYPVLPARVFPCGAAPRDAAGLPRDGAAAAVVLDPGALLDVRCAYRFDAREGNVTISTGWKLHALLHGAEVPQRPAGLVDDAYTLVVRVVEGSAHDASSPATLQCFVRRGPLLGPSPAADCHAPLVVDSDPPRTTVRLDPARVAQDGALYVNRTVAYRSLELAFHPEAALGLDGVRRCAGAPLAAWLLPFDPPGLLDPATRCVRALPYVEGRAAAPRDFPLLDAPLAELRLRFHADAACGGVPHGNLTAPRRQADQAPRDDAPVRCVLLASVAPDHPDDAGAFAVRSLLGGQEAYAPVAIEEEPRSPEEQARHSPLASWTLAHRLATRAPGGAWQPGPWAERALAGPQGAVRVPACEGAPGCLEARHGRAETLVVIEAEGLAVDLAGNRERRRDAGDPETVATLDVDPPTSQLCTAVGTSTQLGPVDGSLPRQRTRERSLPMAWNQTHGEFLQEDPATGKLSVVRHCQPDPHRAVGDNDAVEAVRVAYAVRPRFPEPAVHELDRAWVPGEAEQAAQAGRLDFAAEGLDGVLTNNLTLYAMALAVDRAGNVQDRDLARSRTTYDDHGPELTLLDLAAEHDRVAYRWRAEDREVEGRVPADGSWVLWGPVDPVTGIANLSRRTPASQVGLVAQAVVEGLDQDTRYAFQAWSVDDVGNPTARPLETRDTEPVVRLAIDRPRPGDILRGPAELRLNVSGVRLDPHVHYKVTLLVATPNGTQAIPADQFARRECLAPEAGCPSLGTVVQASRTLATQRFPDAREAWLRVEANNTLNPGQPVVASVGPLKVDNTPPVTTPRPEGLGGPQWFRSSVLYHLAAEDPVAGVASTEYSLDNFTFQPYDPARPPVFDREGSVPVFFRSTDLAGNVEGLRVASVDIDRQRPTGSLLVNGGAQATASRNVTLALQALDALSGVANVTLDTGGLGQPLEDPSRFARVRTLPAQLPAQDGERRVRVQVLDRAGNALELKTSILLDTTPPGASQLKVERVTHTTATLSWRTDEASPSRVEYGPLGALVMANRFVANDTALRHLVLLQGLRPSMDYQFRVVAEDAVGNRATLRGTFETLPDTSPPGGVAGLRALDLGNGVLRLSWDPAFDDVGVEHYVVYRGVGGDLQELGRTAEALYLDDTGIPGTSYEYAVRAVDLAGQQGPLSNAERGRATTRPQLLEPSVDPARGPATQVFTYRVVVQDPDGDAPWAVRVRVGERTFDMQPHFEGRADFARGVPYQVSLRLPATTLGAGFPTFQFEAEDARGVVQAPDRPLAGPAVLGPGAVLPDLQGARDVLGLPGFGAGLVALALVAALALRARRGRREP